MRRFIRDGGLFLVGFLAASIVAGLLDELIFGVIYVYNKIRYHSFGI